MLQKVNLDVATLSDENGCPSASMVVEKIVLNTILLDPSASYILLGYSHIARENFFRIARHGTCLCLGRTFTILSCTEPKVCSIAWH
jgi:hypothetical protein